MARLSVARVRNRTITRRPRHRVTVAHDAVMVGAMPFCHSERDPVGRMSLGQPFGNDVALLTGDLIGDLPDGTRTGFGAVVVLSVCGHDLCGLLNDALTLIPPTRLHKIGVIISQGG